MFAIVVSVITLLYLLATSSVILLSDNKSKINRSLATALIFMGIWLVGVTGLSAAFGSSTYYGRAVFLIAIIGFHMFLVFSYYFAQSASSFKWPVALRWYNVAAALIFVLTLTPMIIQSVEVTQGDKLPNPVYGPLYFLFIVWAVLIGYSMVAMLLRAQKNARGIKRSQVQVVLFGLGLFIVIATISNVILPQIFHTAETARITPLTTIVLATFLSYAVVKHRFLDIRLVVARSLAYIFALATLAFAYGYFVFGVVDRFFPDTDITGLQQTLYTLSAVFLVFTFQPLKRFFDNITNKVFYRDAYDTQAFLDQLNEELVTNVDLTRLLTRSAGIVENNIKAQYCLFMLRATAYSPQRVIGTADKRFSEKDIQDVLAADLPPEASIVVADEIGEHSGLKRKLRDHDTAILAQLAIDAENQRGQLGYLVLGQKKSGNSYNSQDLKVIEIIANELAIAIQNALRFEEIEAFNVTLQEKVDSATRSLQHTNEKLKRLDETKDDFISMASHQLRTPLTSMRGYLSMVLDGDTGEINKTQRKMLDQAFTSSSRMTYLIGDLLNVSRLRTGKFIIDATEIDLSELIGDEVETLQSTAESRSIKLLYKRPKDFPILMLDETKIRQVIMNMVDNALHYTNERGTVQVELKNLSSSVEFRVIDDGIGVPRSEQHRLFNKFYRAGNARKFRPDGTGLGLFMAKKVIVAQGGAIIFKSKEGQGSTFGFTFPKAKLLPAKHKNPPKHSEKPQAH